MPEAEVLVFEPTDCKTIDKAGSGRQFSSESSHAFPVIIIIAAPRMRIRGWSSSTRDGRSQTGWKMMTMLCLHRVNVQLRLSSLFVDSRFMCFRSVGEETE